MAVNVVAPDGAERDRAAALCAEEVEIARRFGAPSALGVALHGPGGSRRATPAWRV